MYMYQQAEDMKTTENIDVNCIEPQYEYQPSIHQTTGETLAVQNKRQNKKKKQGKELFWIC